LKGPLRYPSPAAAHEIGCRGADVEEGPRDRTASLCFAPCGKRKWTNSIRRYVFLNQIVVTVDGIYKERYITRGGFEVLASSTVFVGGSEPDVAAAAVRAMASVKANAGANSAVTDNWVGCLKKVGYFLP